MEEQKATTTPIGEAISRMGKRAGTLRTSYRRLGWFSIPWLVLMLCDCNPNEEGILRLVLALTLMPLCIGVSRLYPGDH